MGQYNPEHDELENNWGCHLANGTASGSRCFQGFDREVIRNVPGYRLHSLEASGTAANSTALQHLSDYQLGRALFGIGCYAGGDHVLTTLSSSAFTNKAHLSVPKSYEDATQRCKLQTVPLPYMVPCEKYSDTAQYFYESRCLRALHKRLLVAELIGKPYKVLMFEYILGGCGAELSTDFLERLAPVLKTFNVTVIADEVLTGGRVGASMTMTTRMPAIFQERVEMITMGKFMNAAIVLKKLTKKPSVCDDPARGTSTNIECFEACSKFNLVASRSYMIPQRQRLVLDTLGVRKEKEHYWGQGLLLFTNRTRPQLTQGLKNRILPRLDDMKIKKLRCVKSDWTRSTVAKLVKRTVEDWLKKQQVVAEKGKYTFVVALVDYIFACPSAAHNDEATTSTLQFRQEHIWSFIGDELAKQKATVVRCALRDQGIITRKRPESFLQTAILAAVSHTRDARSIYKKRIGWERTEYIFVDKSRIMNRKTGKMLS